MKKVQMNLKRFILFTIAIIMLSSVISTSIATMVLQDKNNNEVAVNIEEQSKDETFESNNEVEETTTEDKINVDDEVDNNDFAKDEKILDIAEENFDAINNEIINTSADIDGKVLSLSIPENNYLQNGYFRYKIEGLGDMPDEVTDLIIRADGNKKNIPRAYITAYYYIKYYETTGELLETINAPISLVFDVDTSTYTLTNDLVDYEFSYELNEIENNKYSFTEVKK